MASIEALGVNVGDLEDVSNTNDKYEERDSLMLYSDNDSILLEASTEDGFIRVVDSKDISDKRDNDEAMDSWLLCSDDDSKILLTSELVGYGDVEK